MKKMIGILILINFLLINSIKFEYLTPKYKKKIFENNNDELIEIANYERINPNDPNYIYVPIFGTSDIHGHFYPNPFELDHLNYSQGGLDYMAKYINIIRNEFNNKMLYLDAGDLFQGGIETTITDADIMIDYFNAAKLDGLTAGNHEFDYDRSFIEQKLNQSNFSMIAANFYDKVEKTRKIYGEKQVISNIYTFKYDINNEEVEIKIGVVGLAMEVTQRQITGEGYENVEFKDYKSIVESEARELKNEKKVNAVVLLSHIGFFCGHGNDVNFTLNIYKQKDEQEKCTQDSNLTTLLNTIEEGLIDAVVTGHSHNEVHHWLKDIPIISPVNNGVYANIIYLAFDKNNDLKIVPGENRIEGPLPICEKIFEQNHRCESVKDSDLDKYLPLVEYKFHGVKIEKDENLKFIHDKYDEIYYNYSEIICKIIGTDETMLRYTNGSFYLGNIIADIQRKYTGSQLSIVSYRGLRTEWNPGDLPKYKIYDLLPFGNSLCSFSMTGREIKMASKILQSGVKRFYILGGVKQIVIRTNNGDYLSSIKLFDGFKEEEFEDEKEYLVSANSFLANGGDEFSTIYKFYKPKNLRCDYGSEADLVLQYLKDNKIIDVNKYMDDNNPVIRFINKITDTNIIKKSIIYK